MNLARLAMDRKPFTLFLSVLLALVGAASYFTLGRLEDPDFTVKTAVVLTPYPGASPMEVAQEVTDEIEQVLQRLPQLKRVRSQSRRGLSVVYVDIKDRYTGDKLTQVWDELRRKISDAERKLPPGAGKPIVNDDFGDVFGVMLAVTGDGYSMADLKSYGEDIKKKLLLVPDVAQVSLWGERTEAIFVEMSRSRMTELGIPPEHMASTLQGQNLVVDGGSVRSGPLRIPLAPTGEFKSAEAIGDLLIRGGLSGRLMALKDGASIYRSYLDPPNRVMAFNGVPAIAIGVSTVPGGNVVRMGDRIKEKLKAIQSELPLGVEIHTVTYQSDLVRQAVKGFGMNLVMAVAIVILLLVVFMGPVSGFLMGSILILTVAGTFIAMKIMGIPLHSVSLGSLILALGMLVDNGIVVTEGILVGVSAGKDAKKTALEIVEENKWPLLGATVVAILAFAAIGFSEDIAGEFCRSLFQVVAVSLLLSWVLAITVTPLLGVMFLKPQGPEKARSMKFFDLYRSILTWSVNRRWLTLGIVVLLLAAAIVGFRLVEREFFPETVRDQFMVHYWLPEGTDISKTAGDLKEISDHLLESEKSVVSVASFSGEGPLRFYLAMEPELPDSSYGFLLVTVKDYKAIDGVISRQKLWVSERFPDSEPRFERFKKGPGSGAKIKFRITGSDPEVLRSLSEQVRSVMAREAGAVNVKDEWRQKVKVLIPEVDEARARRSGLTRAEVTGALGANFQGMAVGVYREGNLLLPIVARAPERERVNLNSVRDVQLWSRGLRRFVPAGQVLSDLSLGWEDPMIWRRDRSFVITPQCDPEGMTASELRLRLMPALKDLDLPKGYETAWGGEAEDSSTSERALVAPFAVSLVLMVITVMALFRGFRQPLVVFLCLPLAATGVTFGLLITGKSFGFIALLGYLSLAGMLIKNAIVLLNQIEIELSRGKPRFLAVKEASAGRIRPVMMAAMTTVLGMAPLVFDDFFASLAVTVMFGLTFATALTLFIVPVLFCTFYGISTDEE